MHCERILNLIFVVVLCLIDDTLAKGKTIAAIAMNGRKVFANQMGTLVRL
jgi:hypothetical protein